MENVKLDLIPGRVMPICHASQYDVGRVIRFNLVENDVPYVLDGTETVTFAERKIDGNVVTAACVVTATKSYVDLETTEQMCACYGQNLCELKIEKGSDIIGTLNFVLDVERDPLEGGVQSESEIYNLQVQINEIIQQELENYDIYGAYVTEQTSGAVANFTDGADDVPVKALSVDFSASQASGTPTPANPIPIVGVDKVNVACCGKNLFDKSKMVISTQRFVKYGVDNYSDTLPNGKIRLNANQAYTFSFSGVNSTNFESFSVYNEAGTRVSVVYNNKKSTFTPASTGAYFLAFAVSSGNWGGTWDNYDIQLELGSTATDFEPYNGTTALINLGGTYYGGSVDAVTGKITKNYGKIVFDGSQSNTDFAFTTQDGKSRITWIPFQTLGKVGSKAFKSDKLATASGYVSLPDEWTVANSAASVARCFIGVPSTITSVADWQAYVTSNHITLLYEVATPATAQASNTIELNTLLGVNNIFSDAGDVDVTYRADTALYIDKRLNG